MPNIKVPGDMEGFGIVVLEAGSYGLPVIASNIEGIKDAVIDGKTGFLVGAGNAKEYIKKMNELFSLPSSRIINLREGIIKQVNLNYGWDSIIAKYYNNFK